MTPAAQDYSVFFKGTVTHQGPAMTSDFNFNSDISRGFIYYETPSLKTLVGSTASAQMTYFDPVLFLNGPTRSDGSSYLYKCGTTDNCKVKFDIDYTPQVNRIYPSTVYSGQDICFEVFTDKANSDSRSVLTYAKIGGYTVDLSPYEEANLAAVSNWNFYQLCGQAGGNIAAKSYDLTLGSEVGKYLVTNFAKSYDGTSEFTVRSVPKIDSVSTNELYKAAGSIVTITGEGFDPTETNNQVNVDNLSCTVFEASETELKCQLPVQSSASTGSLFAGGIGAFSTEYSTVRNSGVSTTTETPTIKHFTDIESRRNVDDDDDFTRTVEAWFVPPQTGSYIFHASCDDRCTVMLGTTDMDNSSPATIITAYYNTWRNLWAPMDTSTKSSAISLTAGKHYYLKVVHDEHGSSDYMSVGFTIQDSNTAHANSEKGWKKLTIDPHHTYEEYTINLPNNTDVSYRLLMKTSTASACNSVSDSTTAFSAAADGNDFKCISGTFKASSSAAAVRSAVYSHRSTIRGGYGHWTTVTKATLDASGAETDVAANIATYQFKIKGTITVSTPSADSLLLFANDPAVTGHTATVSAKSTTPISGSYRIKLKGSTGADVFTSDIALANYDGHIAKAVIKAVPQYYGRIEFKTGTNKFPTSLEGKELYYRIDGTSYGDLEIVESSDNKITGGSTTEPISYTADNTYMPASNKPLYEVIPGTMVRTVETKAQVTVTTNSILGACPSKASCGVTFINNVGEITARTASSPFTSMTFTGTAIPNADVEYVSVGTLRRCELDSSNAPSATSVACNLENPIAGSHMTYVQTTKGAIANSGVTALDIPIKIDGVSPTTVYTTGGATLTISGNFFPESLAEATSFTDWKVSFANGDACTVTKVSTTSITCVSSSTLTAGTTTITVAFNGKTATGSTSITVSDATESVTSVDKTAVSPAEKQDLVITLSNTPSANAVDYTGILVSADRTIHMKVNSVDTSTKKITARFPGSPKGDSYKLFVEYAGMRFSSSVVLNAKTEITAIEITTNAPAAKSQLGTTGGDLVKFTGTGFSTSISDNVIVFGNVKGTIVSATVTELVARAPANTAGEVEITSFLKPTITLDCKITAGCKLTYAEDSTLTVTSGTTYTAIKGQITISGTGFGANPVAMVDGKTQKVVSSSATEVTVSFINIASPESINLKVRTDTTNLPAVTIQTPIYANLLGVSPSQGSSGGELITISAFGLGTSTTSDISVYYGAGTSKVEICEKSSITLVNSATITCMTKHGLTIPSSSLMVSYNQKSFLDGSLTNKVISCGTATDCQYETTTAATPTITGVSSSGTSLTVSTSGMTFDNTYTVTVHYGGASATSSSISGNDVVATFAKGFPPGVVPIRVSFKKDSRLTYTTKHEKTIELSATGSNINCSWAGGCAISLTQDGLTTAAENNDLTVTVCGEKATPQISSSSQTQLTLWAPKYATTHSLDNFKVSQAGLISGTVTSLPANSGLNAFDGVTNTMFSSTSDNNCYVQVAFESNKVGRLEKLRYFMNRMDNKVTNFVNKLKFQSSNDGTTWTDVFAVDVYLREGWNQYEWKTTPVKHQYYRFFAENSEACQIGEIELWGQIVEDSSATTKTCDVVLTASGKTQTLTGLVTYKDDASSVVTGIAPRFGTYKGGQTVTFTGTGFSTTTSEATVMIDGVQCTVTSATATSLVCTTGARPSINSSPSTILTFSGATKNGHASMQTHTYKYANYWSDLDTWSGEYTPQEGNSVLIPKGQTLVVDVDSTPVLKAVIVQGALVFAPESDATHHRTFDAEYIYVDQGAVFEAGTATERYTSKLTITMHGTRESAQIPVYGNKGIFVRFGQFDMHGAERTHTWTELESTMAKGSSTMKLNAKVDWVVGEEIVIASTDFDLKHAETFRIKSVDNSGTNTIVTVNKPAAYKHYAATTSYTGTNVVDGTTNTKTKSISMRAEVGLLSRNVVYKGADDDSVKQQYGAHIMLHSPGDESLTGRISYSEFTQVGQAFQLGRYPIHFHMIGTVHNSYIKGNAIHRTYNRACTIHGVHYLTLENNVAYETMGHTFFIEDGAETKNYLKNNLAIKTQRSWSLLNTDQTPASFWITNPDNQFIGNHAAGSDRYGFWFDLQEHPTGPSFDPNICPEFARLGEFTGNVAHSNGRYGLRIFHRFTPTNNPCAALQTRAHDNREMPDPTIATPIETRFDDFTSYKNFRTGLIGTEIGAVKFYDVKVADNLLSGVELSNTMAGPWLSTTDNYHLQDALIVAASDNAEALQYSHADVLTTRGLKGAKTEKMRVKDTLFVNFNADSRWGAIGTCSHCEGPATDSSGRTYFFKNLFFKDTTQRVKFDTPFKEIIYDEDGSLGNSTHRWIVFYFKHLDVPECIRNEATYNGLLCSKDISIRRILFYSPTPYDSLKYLPMKVLNLNTLSTTRRNLASTDVSPSWCPTDTNTAAALKTVDDEALAKQKTLLTKYGEYKTAKIEYDAAVKAFETSNSSTDQARSATALSTMETLKTEIDALVPQVEAYHGKYDELWKVDKNYCNTNNFATIDFRIKANPMKNWVFNVISGYEYKTHVGNFGVDFNTMPIQYSYKELLNGETAGVILHLNHTERAEAFYVDYTDSTTKKKTQGEAKESILQLSDSTLKMGDYHMNNVTRHVTIKFDGTNDDKRIFTLRREECITVGGCNSKATEEGEIETTTRNWSDVNAWSLTNKIPVAGDEVVIDSTWNMVLDVKDLPVFKTIEVNGRLTVKNDGSDYHIQSQLIYVRKGELIIGTEEEPFTGTVKFTLHGTRADKDIYFHDKMFEGGNKAIANTGKLRMYGKKVGLKWSRLAAPATAGTKTITLVDTPTDWAAGDKVGIAPSGREYTHRDVSTIASISGKTITLNDNLAHDHFGAGAIDASKTGTIDIRTEVVHLSRNIVIEGTNEDRWGAHIVTAHNLDTGIVDGKIVSISRKGNAIIDHVEFRNCSQYDTDKAAVRFAAFTSLTDEDTKSSVTNSVIHDGLGIGIMVTSADHVTVNNNMVWFQHIGGIWMKQSHHTTITNNVVAGMGTRYWSGNTQLDEIAAYNMCNNFQKCENLVMKNNIAAGGERIAFAVPTVKCSELDTSYENNVAHSFAHGTFLFSNELHTDECFGNFKAYKTREQGVFGYQGFDAITVKNIETLDCSRGATIMIGKNQDNNIIKIENAVFWGESEDIKDKGDECVEIFGLWLPAASNAGKVLPEVKMSKLPYEKIKSYQNWNTEVTLTNVEFKNWKAGTRKHCESASTNMQRALFINRYNSDHVPVNRFVNTKFSEVANEALTYLEDPNPGWAIIKDCGAFPCTAPDNAVLKFTGATATGSLQPTVDSIGTTAGATFQILPNNPFAVDSISTCKSVSEWNGYVCYNTGVAQIMFESLDADKEERTVSPIHIISTDTTNAFNNTLNTMMDHCWDGHYTCQKRLSRFPGLLDTALDYEVYYTGTPPGNTRYMLQGAEDGQSIIVTIDFSKSIVYKVYAKEGTNAETLVPANRFDQTSKSIPAVARTKCGNNRYEQKTYVYEFFLSKNCIVRLEAQEHLFGLVRLQMSLDQFFENDFVSKLSFALGITTDQIRVVSTQAGSTIIYYQITSTASDSTSQRKNLIELNDMLASKHARGTLDLGAPILDLVTQVISASGATITSGTADYTKKEVHATVYVLLGFSALAVLIGTGYGIFKVVKMSKAYKEVSNIDTTYNDEKPDANEIDADKVEENRSNIPDLREEAKAQ